MSIAAESTMSSHEHAPQWQRRLQDLGEALLLPLVFWVVASVVRESGIVPHASIFGMAASIAVATWLMRRRGETWAGLGFKRPDKLWLAGVLTVASVVIGYGSAVLATMYIAPLMGLGSHGHEGGFFEAGDLAAYLTVLFVMAWASAAFGEELTYRGFIMRRFEQAFGGGYFGMGMAIVLQATIFGAGHFRMGAMGMLVAGTIGLAFGILYYVGKRNLWHLILAHGFIDTFSLTMLYLGVQH